MADLFQELIADQDYQALTPDEQRQVRQTYFDKKVAADQDYRALDKASQVEVKNAIYNHKPVEQPTLAVGEKLGLNIPIPHVLNEYMTRTGRRMHEAGKSAQNLPAAVESLITGKRDVQLADVGTGEKFDAPGLTFPRGRAALETLSGLASGFNFASAPIDAAGEQAARGGLGLSEETARNVGDFTSAALGVP